MATPNSQQGLINNLPVLLIGLTGLICLILTAGYTALWVTLVGLILLWLLRAYSGRVCETGEGRLIYSALWALNFLIAVHFLFPLLLSMRGLPLIIRFADGAFSLNYDSLLMVVVWLITFFSCKMYYDRKAIPAVAQSTVSQSPQAHP